MKPVGFLERLAAPFRPEPVHETAPFRRPIPRRWRKAVSALALAPAAAAGRLTLRLAGRAAPLDPARVRRIAFLKLDHLGDVLMATPLLRALKAWAPEAELVVWTRPANAEAVLRLPAVDRMEVADVPWIRPDAGARGNLRACLALAARVREGRYDLAVDLRYHNRLDSLLLSLCGARARLGFDAGGFGFGLTHRAPWPRGGHEVERQAAGLRAFGIPVADLTPEFPLRDAERAAAARWVPRGSKVVAIHPGAGNAIKRWMPDRFAWAARELVRRAKVRVAVLAGPGEEPLAEPIARAVPRTALLDLRRGLGLGELAAVLARAALFLGNDGGAAHLAAAVGAPALVVFSGTNRADDWRPLGGRVDVVESWVPCKPCHSTTCPFDQACLRQVGVEPVLERALARLSGRRGVSSGGKRKG